MSRWAVAAAVMLMSALGGEGLAQSAQAWRSTVMEGGGLAWSLKSNDFNGRPGAARYAIYFHAGTMLGGTHVQYVSRLVEVDCAERRLKGIESDYALMNGEIVTRSALTSDWVTPDTDSSEASLLQAWCDGGEFPGQQIHDDLDEALARIRSGV